MFVQLEWCPRGRCPETALLSYFDRILLPLIFTVFSQALWLPIDILCYAGFESLFCWPFNDSFDSNNGQIVPYCVTDAVLYSCDM